MSVDFVYLKIFFKTFFGNGFLCVFLFRFIEIKLKMYEIKVEKVLSSVGCWGIWSSCGDEKEPCFGLKLSNSAYN